MAAIAPIEAADIYGLHVLATSIQTIKNNVTRFVIVQQKNGALPKDQINKASLKFGSITNVGACGCSQCHERLPFEFNQDSVLTCN